MKHAPRNTKRYSKKSNSLTWFVIAPFILLAFLTSAKMVSSAGSDDTATDRVMTSVELATPERCRGDLMKASADTLIDIMAHGFVAGYDEGMWSTDVHLTAKGVNALREKPESRVNFEIAVLCAHTGNAANFVYNGLKI